MLGSERRSQNGGVRARARVEPAGPAHADGADRSPLVALVTPQDALAGQLARVVAQRSESRTSLFRMEAERGSGTSSPPKGNTSTKKTNTQQKQRRTTAQPLVDDDWLVGTAADPRKAKPNKTQRSQQQSQKARVANRDAKKQAAEARRALRARQAEEQRVERRTFNYHAAVAELKKQLREEADERGVKLTNTNGFEEPEFQKLTAYVQGLPEPQDRTEDGVVEMDGFLARRERARAEVWAYVDRVASVHVVQAGGGQAAKTIGSWSWWASQLGFPRMGEPYAMTRVGSFDNHELHRTYSSDSFRRPAAGFENRPVEQVADEMFAIAPFTDQVHVTATVGPDARNAHVYWGGQYLQGEYVAGPGKDDPDEVLETKMATWRQELKRKIQTAQGLARQ